MFDDTIFALSTVRGKSAVAVVRLSGPDALSAGEALCGELPAPRYASVRNIRDPASNYLIDKALVLALPGPGTFTGEDILELHLHGSLAVIDAVALALSELPNLRAAEPGEFSKRAMLNGKMDLVALEGMADIIAAESAGQHKQAMRAFSGATSDKVSAWRNDLLSAKALLEASIDFADEEVPDDLSSQVLEVLQRLSKALQAEISGFSAARRVREGLEIAIVGRPNAGKSTLANAIIGRAVALTSDVPGTTRDIIEAWITISGQSVCLLDMAGLRETEDVVESLGVSAALNRANSADIRLFLLDNLDDIPKKSVVKQPQDIIAFGKADIRRMPGSLAVSGKTGEGLDRLFDTLSKRVSEMVSGASGFGSERQSKAILNASSSLQMAMSVLGSHQGGFEIVAEHVRYAEAALDSLIGRVDVEDVLGEIFSRFCIGK